MRSVSRCEFRCRQRRSVHQLRLLMNSFVTKQTVALVLGICCLIGSTFAAPWFVGDFRGQRPEAAADPQMSVVCRTGERCVVLAAHAGGQPKPIGIPIQTRPKLIDPGVPNNNWETTRNAVASKPEWYSDRSFGPLLSPLRSALQSEARFAGCVDLDGTSYVALCSLSTDPDAAQTVMLLVNTMNATCGKLPFCAYYFIPLERTSEK